MQASNFGYALVIGIADYQNVRKLSSNTIRDASGMYSILRRPDRLGYSSDHVRTLSEKYATRKEILNGLAWLAYSTDIDNTVIIYYSGHVARFDDSPNFGTH